MPIWCEINATEDQWRKCKQKWEDNYGQLTPDAEIFIVQLLFILLKYKIITFVLSFENGGTKIILRLTKTIKFKQ